MLLNGQYGKENDVFMLGTVMWQVFNISELAARDPLASRRDFAPCAKIEKQQVNVSPLSHFSTLDYYLVLSCQVSSKNNSLVQKQCLYMPILCFSLLV